MNEVGSVGARSSAALLSEVPDSRTVSARLTALHRLLRGALECRAAGHLILAGHQVSINISDSFKSFWTSNVVSGSVEIMSGSRIYASPRFAPNASEIAESHVCATFRLRNRAAEDVSIGDSFLTDSVSVSSGVSN
jgi:hypothetical protein